MNGDKSRKTDRNIERIFEGEPVANRGNASQKKVGNNSINIVNSGHINTLKDNISCAGIHDAHVDEIYTANTLPCRVNGIKEYSLSDETVLYSLEHEAAHSLNSSAKAIWELCDGNNTIVEISQILGKRFGFSGAELLSDVTAVITKLQRLSLLELKDAHRTK